MITNRTNTPHYQWGRGCAAWLLFKSANAIIKEEIMPPGTEEVPHYHAATEQFFYVCEGEAVFYLEDRKYTLRQGDFIPVKNNATHKISNQSGNSLRFLIVSFPGNESDRINV